MLRLQLSELPRPRRLSPSGSLRVPFQKRQRVRGRVKQDTTDIVLAVVRRAKTLLPRVILRRERRMDAAV